ncbi:hypothetical protein C9E85_16355, partial [Plesiomonas shigelloides]
WSTSKTPSYTKSVSWQHHLGAAINSKELPNPGLISQLPQVFDWVRLAENIPVNIHLDSESDMSHFIPGQSATVKILK